ncbi:hypothetical protein CBR_g30248 [Chara braunii]|uniref:Signal recognition particle 14 kDa protein n=1 Tax=Chara braunii TaxID=69332 RepID=A0A388LCD2_CHABU|nr:hypothetical protein CBR_g30248 [Chara braunii]|eukprot:GBG79987.1 hypothetical protein CBR_g30248 [Chara braunii]
MVLLEPDPFLNELTKLYERNKQSGTVWVTLKHSPCKRVNKAQKKDLLDEDCKCLVRATDGKRKISTTLSPKEHIRFQTAYATLLKAHLDNLKKKEKAHKKKPGGGAASSSGAAHGGAS